MCTKNAIEAHFALKAPCSNCPFKIKGAIELEPGRLAGIIEHLLTDDQSTFQCHKTVHSHLGGEWDDEGAYQPSGNEAMCAGAMIYLGKMGRPTVPMRLGMVYGAYKPELLALHFDKVIEPNNKIVRK